MGNDDYRRFSDKYAPRPTQLKNSYGYAAFSASGTDYDVRANTDAFGSMAVAGKLELTTAGAITVKFNDTDNPELPVASSLSLDNMYVENMYITYSGSVNVTLTTYGWK